jgi:protein O-GlcNAc transferase
MLELQLLLACTSVRSEGKGDATIRQLLGQEINWTLFAQKAVDHGLASLAGDNLARVANDIVPKDILDAFRVNLEQTRSKNLLLFQELARIIAALADEGIEAIPLKGPVLAAQAYGDVGLRVFRDLDFLVRDRDMSATMAVLHDLGYERDGTLTNEQIETIQRLQGQDFLYTRVSEIGIEPHTRLTPIKMALDIDYDALWTRARRVSVNGCDMLTLAPEDGLLVLAIHGGKEMWWNIKWACDIAAFITTHSDIDWSAVLENARAQGCLRMVLLATLLARRYFNAELPDTVIARHRSDRVIERMVCDIVSHWTADEPAGPPSNMKLSVDRLQLHDGITRRASYVARTLFLPGPQHVASVSLPSNMQFAYVAIRLAHDLVALPLWRIYRRIVPQLDDPASAEKRLRKRRHEKARVEALCLLAGNPNDVSARENLGEALAGLERYREAIACYDEVLAADPENVDIWKKRRAAMRAIGSNGDFPEPAPDLRDANAWAIRAGYLSALRRYAEAVTASDRALDISPEHLSAVRIGMHSRLFACDWRTRDHDKQVVSAALKGGVRLLGSIDFRRLCEPEEESLTAAKIWAKRYPPAAKPAWRGERYSHQKIRIAYMSADFRDHVVADTIIGCFERHDKGRFETIGISIGPNDGSQIRRRIISAFDRVVDAQRMSDEMVAALLRQLEADIVVDLNGHAGRPRPGILARRPAPLQVNYLGYPGTTGAPFIDYIVADRVVIPEENQRHYTEQVVHLPHSFMASDGQRIVAESTPSRTEAGLPATGFVFASHSDERKFGPEMFDIWMRLLRTVEGSVLWLKSVNESAMANLRREAEVRGVAAQRLIFAPRVPQTEHHLARLRLADLFLDTLPYNAHATACDALWVGLPVLTCRGTAFPGLVGASLLQAIGLPELATSSVTEYEGLALSLARNAERLSDIKAKLMRNRRTEPLFDTARFTRNLETAYVIMHERHQAGFSPTSFAVTE